MSELVTSTQFMKGKYSTKAESLIKYPYVSG